MQLFSIPHDLCAERYEQKVVNVAFNPCTFAIFEDKALQVNVEWKKNGFEEKLPSSNITMENHKFELTKNMVPALLRTPGNLHLGQHGSYQNHW